MLVLADTNILLRLLIPADPEHATVRAAVDAIVARGDQLCFVPQNLVEFRNVCTRPSERNGLGLSSAETETRAKLIESNLVFLPDTDLVHSEWRRLVLTCAVTGVQVHDARLVAAMLAHGIPQLLTLNDRDFRRYPGISVVHPRELARAIPGQ